VAEQFLTVTEVAERLRIMPETVRRWLRAGKIHGVLLGGDKMGYRIAEAEVRRLVGTPGSPKLSEVVIAITHQKGGVGKSTSTALLAAEIAELHSDWSVLVEDLDPYRHLTERWPGGTPSLRLVGEGKERGTVRLIDTGPGDTPAFVQALERADYVVVPVRPEPMSAQALGRFVPVLRQVQAVRGGAPHLAGLIVTHIGPGRGRRQMQEELDRYATELGTSVIGRIPYSDWIGVYLSTHGHYYRPPAEYLVQLVARHGANAVVAA
jgi:excisionase family DNA binding protein